MIGIDGVKAVVVLTAFIAPDTTSGLSYIY